MLGGVALNWPLAAIGQEQAPTVIGVLNGQSPDGYKRIVAAFAELWQNTVMWKAKICGSNFVGPTGGRTGFSNWRPICCAGTWH